MQNLYDGNGDVLKLGLEIDLSGNELNYWALRVRTDKS